MRYSVDWQDDAVNAATEERATLADLRLTLNEQNVCLHLSDGRVRDHLTLPLYTLAEGLAHDWWTLFGSRDNELSFVKHRAGYAVPDVRLSYDGACFEMSARQRIYSNPNIRFWTGPTEVMTRQDAEGQLSGFIDTVLARLAAKGVEGTSAELRWARVQQSRRDVEEASFCEAAGALGLDPYQIDDAAARSIEDASGIFQSEPLTEFLAGSRRANQERLIDWVTCVERRQNNRSRVSGLRSTARSVEAKAPERPTEESWALGYRRAQAMRDVMNLPETRRYPTHKHLAMAVGASSHYEAAPHVDGIRLLRGDHGDDAHLHLRAHGSSQEARATQLFTFARGIGDVICFPDTGRAPVNDLHSAYRQSAGRAFAAEFLAPVNEVLAMRADGKDTITMADEFKVATAVIERQIENAARINQACGQ